MPPNNTSVESYLAEGCGRCELFQTPECKVHAWSEVSFERALFDPHDWFL